MPNPNVVSWKLEGETSDVMHDRVSQQYRVTTEGKLHYAALCSFRE